MQTAKQSAETMIRALPEDASFEEIQYRLYVLEKIAAGVASLAENGGIPHSEVMERFAKWLTGATLGSALDRAFAAVSARRVLPSMRSLQFGGEAILRHHAQLFNCSFSPVDRLEFFREYLFLLLAGTGCGFSVQRHHVDRLPPLPVRGEELELPVVHHAVSDTIEGWGDHLVVRSPDLKEGYASLLERKREIVDWARQSDALEELPRPAPLPTRRGFLRWLPVM